MTKRLSNEMVESVSSDKVTTTDSGGSRWTNLTGFVARLLSSAGSSIIGFIQIGAGAILRNIQDKLRETISVKDFGAKGDGATDNTAAVTAALSSSSDRVVTLPRKARQSGNYVVSSGFYGYPNSRFQGDGRLVINGKGQARDRAFISQEMGDTDDSNSFENWFDGDWSKQFRTSYSFVASAVGTANITQYRHLTRAAQDIHVMFHTGGKNTAENDQVGGRTGVWREMVYLTHGGQGDFGTTYYRLAGYSTRGGTHWLAEPALSTQAYDFDTLSSANGLYQQRSEVNHKDYNDGTTQVGINVGTDTVNYTRNSNITTKYQGWGFLRTQSIGTYAIDYVISPAGLHKRIIDTSPTNLGSDGAAFALLGGHYTYLDCIAAPDPLGIKRVSTLTDTRFGFDPARQAVITKLASGKKVGVENPEGVFLADPTAWKTPTLLNSWTGYTTQQQSAPKYRRNLAGQVVLKGHASGGAALTTVLTLPVGYRPPEKLYFVTNGTFGIVQILIDTDGNVYAQNPATDGSVRYISLDGIIFEL